jgi:hypothetical protein
MKRAIHIHWLAAGLLASVAFGASAQSVGVSAGVEVAPDRAPVAEEDDDRVDRHCLRHTGSRITASRATASRTGARKHDRRCAPAFGRVWTREDLERTGRIDIADALRTLDPSIR